MGPLRDDEVRVCLSRGIQRMNLFHKFGSVLRPAEFVTHACFSKFDLGVGEKGEVIEKETNFHP